MTWYFIKIKQRSPTNKLIVSELLLSWLVTFYHGWLCLNTLFTSSDFLVFCGMAVYNFSNIFKQTTIPHVLKIMCKFEII